MTLAGQINDAWDKALDNPCTCDKNDVECPYCNGIARARKFTIELLPPIPLSKATQMHEALQRIAQYAGGPCDDPTVAQTMAQYAMDVLAAVQEDPIAREWRQAIDQLRAIAAHNKRDLPGLSVVCDKLAALWFALPRRVLEASGE